MKLGWGWRKGGGVRGVDRGYWILRFGGGGGRGGKDTGVRRLEVGRSGEREIMMWVVSILF